MKGDDEIAVFLLAAFFTAVYLVWIPLLLALPELFVCTAAVWYAWRRIVDLPSRPETTSGGASRCE